MEEIKDIVVGGSLIVDSIKILLRNDIAKDVEAHCHVRVGQMPISYGAADIHFEPSEKLINFLKEEIDRAIEDSKITSNFAYLEKIKK